MFCTADNIMQFSFDTNVFKKLLENHYNDLVINVLRNQFLVDIRIPPIHALRGNMFQISVNVLLQITLTKNVVINVMLYLLNPGFLSLYVAIAPQTAARPFIFI